MKKVLKIILIIIGVIAALVVILLAFIYIPSPKFEQVAYEPTAPTQLTLTFDQNMLEVTEISVLGLTTYSGEIK